MERHLGLPLAFAAAFHGALLFGFVKHPPPALVRYIPMPDFFPPAAPIDDDDPPPPEPEADKRPEDIAPPQPMRQPEPIPIAAPDKMTFVPPVITVDPNALPTDIAGAPIDGAKIRSEIGDIFSSTSLDKTPRTRFQPPPTYPFEGKQAGLHGEVVVEFIVDESGRVRDPHVVRSSHRMFEEPTIRAVSRWQFEPGRRGGQIVRFRMMVPVMFNLND